jgi:threonine aldolase
MNKHTFASDNYSGVHPSVMNAMIKANAGHASSYGTDDHTNYAKEKFKQFFGEQTEVFLVYNGTGANVLALSAITNSFNSIICSNLAHINVDESTAPEKFTGCKLVTIPTNNGKIYPVDIENTIQRLGDQHHPQAKVISISQSTEYGTVYTLAEIKALSAVAKKYDLFFHMDGSRIANAAVSLGEDFKTFTVDAGVDVLSFGGTKNGMMFGEAVLFLNSRLSKNFKYICKQGMQLHSKGRFIGAQFNALLSDDIWKKNAAHANAMAKQLEMGLKAIPGVTITQRVDANGVFAIIPAAAIEPLQQEHFFYVWNEKTSEIRLMCSFDTSEDDVNRFIITLRQLVA